MPAPPPPAGVPVVLDADVRILDGGRILLGGDPGRLVRLTSAGARALSALDAPTAGPIGALARTLLDGGLAHPRPGPVAAPEVTVVVPVRDRARELDRCLGALGRAARVLVVGDGSTDPGAVAAVCAAHGAALLPRGRNGGPAAARNDGVAAVGTALVAFLDSDCVPPPGWLAALAGHFADPAVGAVAPRVRAEGGRGVLARYAAARGPLDLGDRAAVVRPGSRVPYVPTAALVVRREALVRVAGEQGPFDPSLRFGEDVDLVWRLADAGWRVRYDPRVEAVRHAEPGDWGSWLRRRRDYGTSAAPLAARHGRRLTPLVVPWPWVAAAGLLALRRPSAAAAAAAVPAVRLFRGLRRAGLPVGSSARVAAGVTGRGLVAGAAGMGGAGAVTVLPVALPALLNRSTRTAAVTALVVPPLLDALIRRPALDPLRWVALRLLDDAAYAAGVWRGCWTGRTLAPLRPQTTRPR